MISMKFLIQFLVFAVCYCLNDYAAPFFKDLGCALGILVFGDQDGGAILCGLLVGALAVLVYGAGFAVAKRINERRLDGSLKYAPGIKRTIFALPLLLADAAIADSAGTQTPFFGSGDFVVPASGAQLLYDLLFLSAFHWMGVLGLVSLIWGLVTFCRCKAAAPRPAPSKFTEEAAPVPMQPSAAPKPKAGFCKLCGNPIDPVTRKCTGCRKQYFRPPIFTDKHYFIAATAVACVAVVVLLVMLISQRSTYESQIAELSEQVSDLENELDHLTRSLDGYKRSDTNLRSQLSSTRETIERLQEENDDMSSEIAFYDRHIVFIADDGTNKYHNYRCPYLDTSHFWAYNTENAKGQGYKPCSHCCG